MRVPEYTQQSLQKLVSEESLTLVQFGTDWCAPCKRQERVLLEAMTGFARDLKIGKVNVEDWPDCAAVHGVSRNPTLCLFQAGERIGFHEGFLTLDGLENFVRLGSSPR